MSDHTLAVLGLLVSAIGSVGTIAALVVAIVIGLHESKAIRAENADRQRDREEERERDDRERERQTREQAERVSAQLHVEYEAAPDYTLGTVSDHVRRAKHFAYVEIFNASGLPIYDIEVIVGRTDRPGIVSRISHQFVAGGEKGHAHALPQPNNDLHGSPLELVFRDGAGRTWHRHEDGLVHQMSEEERRLWYAANDPTADHPATADADLPVLDLDRDL